MNELQLRNLILQRKRRGQSQTYWRVISLLVSLGYLAIAFALSMLRPLPMLSLLPESKPRLHFHRHIHQVARVSLIPTDMNADSITTAKTHVVQNPNRTGKTMILILRSVGVNSDKMFTCLLASKCCIYRVMACPPTGDRFIAPLSK